MSLDGLVLRLWQLQCVSNGVTVFLRKSMDVVWYFEFLGISRFLYLWFISYDADSIHIMKDFWIIVCDLSLRYITPWKLCLVYRYSAECKPVAVMMCCFLREVMTWSVGCIWTYVDWDDSATSLAVSLLSATTHPSKSAAVTHQSRSAYWNCRQR